MPKDFMRNLHYYPSTETLTKYSMKREIVKSRILMKVNPLTLWLRVVSLDRAEKRLRMRQVGSTVVHET